MGDQRNHIVPDPVRVPQLIRGTDGIVREYAPVPTVRIHVDRDGVTYCWSGVPKDRALAMFADGARPTVADMVRVMGPCAVDLTERVTAGGG